VRNRVDVPFRDLGEHTVKHVTHPVRVYAIGVEEPAQVTASAGQATADKPSIAVLPFDNLSGDPEQEYFSDGITEDIITALSRIRQFFVIARNTTFTYKGQAVDVQAIASDLGVRYVLEGSVRKAGSRVRITAQLIDGATGNHLWAEKYDRDLDNIFAVQDEITLTVVGAIEPELGKAEIERARTKKSENFDAWELYHRGMAHFYLRSKEDMVAAQESFGRAIVIDPNFAPAYSGSATVYYNNVIFGYSDAPENDRELAMERAQKGVDLDANDPAAYAILDLVSYVRRSERAIRALQKSLELNPSSALTHSALGFALADIGRFDDATIHHDQAMHLGQRDPILPMMMGRRGASLYWAGRYEEAIEVMNQATSNPNAQLWQYFAVIAASLVKLGRMDEARDTIEQVRKVNPGITLKTVREFAFSGTENLDRFVADLREAGLPEDAPEEATAPSLPDKPSIAVLPFDNLSGDPEQEYFSDGITEDIITALSRIRQFFVIARNTTFTYKGQAVDVQAIAKDLGVRYVLEGSVRKAGSRVRITAQLFDGESGNHIWAEKYDRDLEDIFAVQDEITQAVAGAVGPELRQAEAARAKMKSPENLGAWDYCQRGLAVYYQRSTPDNKIEAIQNFQKAIELDANFALPWAGIAHAMYRQIIQGIGNTPEARDKIVRAGREAVKLDNQDAVTHTALCGAYLVTRQHGKAIQEGEIACELNPNHFQGNFWTGAALIWSGEPAKGIPFVEQALKTSPRDPSMGQALSRLAEAQISLGDYPEAAGLAKRAVTHPRAGIWPEATPAAALALAGESDDDIAAARAAVLDRTPDFTSAHFRDNFPATDPHFIEAYVEGLRKAGFPES
jgi:adenylate cyclase